MARLFRLSHALSVALAQAAKLCLAAIMMLIVADVAIRNFGGKPPIWTIPVCEYLMLYIAAFGVPILVRLKGHVVIEIVVRAVHGRARRLLETLIVVVSAAAFAFLAAIAIGMTADALRTGDFQIRSITIPAWVAHLPLAIGFALGALEFLRYLVERDSLFDRRAEDTDSL